MSHPISGVKIYAKHPAWTPVGGSAGDYQQFNQDDGLREFKIGPFDLMHSWDDRTSVGDGVKQMRPNLFKEYAEVTFSFVSLFGTAGSFPKVHRTMRNGRQHCHGVDSEIRVCNGRGRRSRLRRRRE